MVKVTEFETAKVLVSNTLTWAVPGWETCAVAIQPRISVALILTVGQVLPLNWTTLEAENPVPSTANLNPSEPAFTTAGLTELTTGVTCASASA
jgi:hypothetical protein